MRYQRLCINCLAVVLGSCIAVSLYSTLHVDSRLTRGNTLVLQDEYRADGGGTRRAEKEEPTKISGAGGLAEIVKNMQAAKALAEADGLIALGPDPEFAFRCNPNFTRSTCPTSVQDKLTALEWTKHWYHPEVTQVMHPAVFNVTEYERLLPYWMPFGYKYHVELKYADLKHIVGLFSTGSSLLGLPPNQPGTCTTCAVVGNGGMLRNSGNGDEIDRHDLVFRVNNALRKGFEDDVGNRTTHYVFMDRSLVHMPKHAVPRDKGIKYLFLPCRLKDYYYIKDVVTRANSKQKLSADPKDVRIFHPDFVRYIQKIWMITKSFRPSTGAIMFFAALHGGCDQISVYGMGFNAQYTEHYYDKEYRKYTNVKGSHDFQREISILKRLHGDGVITWASRDVVEFQR